MTDLATAGRTALEAAFGLWHNLVIEPRKPGQEPQSAAMIDQMIRYETGLGWSWAPPFDEGSDYEWCGAFAAWCWAHAGLALDLRRLYWSSTSRLAAYARGVEHFGTANERAVMTRYPAAGRISIALDERSTPKALTVEPQAGDILLVGYPGSRMGTHVTLVESFDAAKRVFHTVEGNARGRWPDGKARPNTQGVVRQTRPLGLARGETGYHARRLIRPSLLDLVPEGVS